MYEDGKCRGQHKHCCHCDEMRHDPHTGWFGFADHFAKKHFISEEEQKEYYANAKLYGETGEQSEWP